MIISLIEKLMYTVDQILQQINDVTRTLTRTSGLQRQGGGGGGTSTTTLTKQLLNLCQIMFRYCKR